VSRATTREGATPGFLSFLDPAQGSLPHECKPAARSSHRSEPRNSTEVLGRVEASLVALAAARPRHVLRASMCPHLPERCRSAGRPVPSESIRACMTLVGLRTLQRCLPTHPHASVDARRMGDRGAVSDETPAARRPGSSRRSRIVDGRLLSAQDAARYLGVPYTSLRDWALRGHIPIVRVPACRRLWFDRRDLDSAIDAWRERLEPGELVFSRRR
jgi:hypothetical protein